MDREPNGLQLPSLMMPPPISTLRSLFSSNSASSGYQELPTHTPPSPSLKQSSWRSRLSSSRTSIRRAYLTVCVVSILYLIFLTYPTSLNYLAPLEGFSDPLEADHFEADHFEADHYEAEPPEEVFSAHVYELSEDVCIDQLHSLIPQGSFLKFSQNSSFDNFYVPIKPKPQAARPTPKRTPALEVPPHCLDDHLAQGATCVSDAPSPKLDVVWTYVNGTDMLHQVRYKENMAAEKAAHPILHSLLPKAGSFREFDELRYSLRSVLSNFRQSAGKLFLVGSDFLWPGCEDGEGRLGQLPQWLDPEHARENETWTDGDLSLHALHHSEIFGDLRNKSTFNSIAIESRLNHIPGVTDNFVYMNDDVFLNRELTVDDFYRRDLGPVFRLQPDLVINGVGAVRGEWVAVQQANILLNDRFGARSRPYVAHFAKTLSVTFLEEISTIWPDVFATTASHPFRNLNLRYEPDVSPTVLMTHYVVERWREALLWSYIVGKIGGDDDEWSPEHSEKVWEELGGKPENRYIDVQRRARTTLERADTWLDETSGRTKRPTKYNFSSYDGYPYYKLGVKGFKTWPSFAAQDKSGAIPGHLANKCALPPSCFMISGNASNHASEIFKGLAFRTPQCGDCLINALMSKASSGLEAFLPPSDRAFPQNDGSSPSPDFTPRLPMTKDWQTTDFRLTSMDTGDLSVRQWLLQALIRYRFVLGNSEAQFVMNTSPVNTQKNLATMDNYRNTEKDPAIICINDDVTRSPHLVKKYMKDWFQKKWPKPAEWEAV